MFIIIKLIRNYISIYPWYLHVVSLNEHKIKIIFNVELINEIKYF